MAVTLCLAGDVMTGRGVDQILPHLGDPRLHESYIKDAGDYVRLAEAVNGPIPRPVDWAWPWGDALDLIAAHTSVINLETAITAHGTPAIGKGIHYRMHPANVPCLTVARPNVCVLANNHILDYGERGLLETCSSLQNAGLAVVGAGRDVASAQRPARCGRILVFGLGMSSSGVPRSWAAQQRRPGVWWEPSAAEIGVGMRAGDITVASIHWGSNWGYEVDAATVRYAHQLIDGGVDVVHGHSSHHPRPIEIYNGRLILYGCGDLVNDYEGIGGYEGYRDDLRLLYFPRLDDDGTLESLRVVPMQARQMRLRRASTADATWAGNVLERISNLPFVLENDGTLRLASH